MGFNKKEYVDLAINAYYGTNTKFSKDEMNDALRNKLIEVLGTDKINRKTLRRDGDLVFEILEESIGTITERRIEEEFSPFAEYNNVGWGDTKVFTLENPDLFEVALVADGNGNLLRQRLENGEITVKTYMRGVKIYENLYRLLTGRVDFVKMANKVIDSYMNEIYALVYKAMYDMYDSIPDAYKATGSFSSDKFNEKVEHVEAANNASAMVIGTKSALNKVTGTYVSDNMRDEFNSKGYFTSVDGTPMFRIKQVHTPGTDNFAINENFLMILPTGGEKIVKIVEEGDSIIEEQKMKGMDLGSEYMFLRKSGVAVVTGSKIGAYRLS